MFASLSARIYALGALVLLALASFAAILVDSSRQAGEAVQWANHSSTVIETTQIALNQLRSAESGTRGYILTRSPAFAASFDEAVSNADLNIGRVVAMTRDNPAQYSRAQELAKLVKDRCEMLRQSVDLGRRDDFPKAQAKIANGQGRELMDAVLVRTRNFLDNERALQSSRTEAVNERLRWTEGLTLGGAGLVALLVAIGFLLLIRGIDRPLAAVLRVMTDLGNGQRSARIGEAMGSREFSELAQSYNAMADQLERAVADQVSSETQLQEANAELQRNSETLRQRGGVIEMLGGMAHRMQAARTDDELAQIIRVFVPRVLPGIPGALYAHNNSRNLLIPIAGWGGMEADREGFAPEQCWALRRGQSHFLREVGSDIVCSHADPDEIYHCEPLLAGGEVIGVLYLHGTVENETRFRLTVLAENIASALVNHRLQRSLREQTIRDPLTGLFNRRYMEETLTLEIARASRSGVPLSVVMCDIDHFKRFNDEFGHDAGDAVLQAVAAELKKQFRSGDVICRFGGEEFTIIAPGTTAQVLHDRVEQVRHAVGEINVRQKGRTLGLISMSFGIASWAAGMDANGEALIQAADVALYQAKREGRNRVIVNGTVG
ncbi:diguanylate cyclase (GGDEF)-like protein [Novosphingobium sp. SG751A]|uniref:sensor domain-containing diguanylate cyclase n=1 Tax=Novosphingobium sp. SG751A TaxID=2587000 RepID=UPI00155210D7|nr:diguanylate cyclase [Novosphingobium sp. SG751A]NOW48799.1 diguanylate cyclase (GGDEF)-like protein [Novosphingobium sp. SG751A]